MDTLNLLWQATQILSAVAIWFLAIQTIGQGTETR